MAANQSAVGPQVGGGEPVVFADCGNDARICVLDSRQSSSAPVIVIEDEASHGCVVGTDRLRTMLLAGLCF